MRPILISAPIILITLFLGGCWHVTGQPPAPPNGQVPTTTTDTIDTTTTTAGRLYPPETSIEGKTALRYTADGKKVYNNPESGLYFEYAEEWKIARDKYFPYGNNPNVYVGEGQFLTLSTNDNQDIEIRLTSGDFFIEGIEGTVNPLGTTVVNFKDDAKDQIKQVYPACTIDFSNLKGEKWAIVFNVSFYGPPQLIVDSFAQPSSKFHNVYVSYYYRGDITKMTEIETDKIAYANHDSFKKFLNDFCQEEVADDITSVKRSFVYKDYVDILESMRFVSLTDAAGFSWQKYNESAEGIKEGVLPNFQFPYYWYTFNIAGGTRVAIYFSVGEKPTRVDDFEITPNRCGLKILYDGSTRQYYVEKYNNKKVGKDMEECEEILNKLESQVPK